jgi:hypothetical protein
MSSSDDFFSGGMPTLKFETMGAVMGGRIVRIGDPMQQRDFATGAPKFWDKAEREPMMQLPIEVQTDLRDPEVVGDTGVRTLYVKGDLKRAVQEALKKAGVRGAPKVGGDLRVVWTAEEPSTKGNPKKIYAAKYTAPAAGDGFFGDNAGQQAEQRAKAQGDPFAARMNEPMGQPVGATAGPAAGVNPFASGQSPF